MRLKILNLLLLVAFFSVVSCKGYFSIVGSKLMRHKMKYHVSVTSQGFEEPQVLQIAIRNSKKYQGIAFEAFQNVTLINGKTQKVELDLKDQPIQDYNLEVKSLSGESFQKETKLDLNVKKQSVFVQTDKSMYKPADKVQLRVLVLNGQLKPFKNKKVEIFITDGADNRVKQFNDVTLIKGVFQGELQLSDSPVLGKWKIHVKTAGVDETVKAFEVAEYTLPKFEVTIDANPDANFKDGKIRAAVRAKYTFGKIAKGNATVTAEVESLYSWRYWDNSSKSVKVSKSVEVNGKKLIEFDISKELGIQDTNQERIVKLHATFKEELTERELNATAEVKIHITPHKIELKTSSKKFKSDLPFTVTAIVKYHDKDAPVTDKTESFKFTVTYFYDTMKDCGMNSFYPSYPTYASFGARGSTLPYSQTQFSQCRQEHSYEKIFQTSVSAGIANVNIDIPSNTTKIAIEAKYFDTVNAKRNIEAAGSASGQFIQIKSLTESPKLSQIMQIEVLATHPLTMLSMMIIGKGDVIASETFEVPNSKKYLIEFKPTLPMLPNVKVVIYYITEDGELITDSIKIEFGNDLKNHIELQLSKSETKPGEDLELSVTTNPGSFVGLLGVDQSVLILKKGNDIEQSTVFGELEKYNKIDKHNSVWNGNYDWRSFDDFGEAKAVIITNAKDQYVRPSIPNHGGFGGFGGFDGPYFLNVRGCQAFSASASAASQSSSSRFGAPGLSSGYAMMTIPQSRTVAHSMPSDETWIFDSFDFNDTTTNMTLHKKVPDTITSWIITGFSVDPLTGLGLTNQPSKLTVFQPFFVTTNLPYSIKRSEVVSIPVLVFNYMEDDQTAEVTLFNSEGEFEFVEINEKANKVRKTRSLDTQRTKRILVKSQSGVTVPFMIRPLNVGHITIKVTGITSMAGDGLERQLIVEPEGVTQYENKAVFIDLQSIPEFQTKISLVIPANAVPDSTKIEASAIGDILGPTIENLDKLIKLPYGCGEQNMLNFVPNIVVLDYLTALNKLTPEIESKAKRFMETGYQKELTYKHNDGSYSAFRGSDTSGSTWLTAFVVKSFHQATKYIAIDEKIIKEALNFLSMVQAEDGSFPEVGHVSHKDMQGGSSKGIALTAYTLITFLENEKLSKNYKGVIDKALNHITENLSSLDDNYSLAIATYALQVAKHVSKDSFLTKLDGKAELKDGKKSWHKEIPEADKKSPWVTKPNSVNVEMSAYALQAFVEAGRETDGVPIMKWLVGQHNKDGGFTSTQDTVVGLQALSKLAAKIYAPNNNVEIKVTPDEGSTRTLTVNDENALVLQKHELPSNARNFNVSATGKGFGILQLSYKYNLNVTGEWPRFVLEPKVNEDSNKDFLHLTVCTHFVPDKSADKSNMAVMEVAFPSGYTFDTDSATELKMTKNVKKIETKEGETLVVIYFDDIGSEKICPELKAYRTHAVANLKPAPVIIYDYYDNSRRARSFYNSLEVSLCDICNGAEECQADCEQEEINVV